MKRYAKRAAVVAAGLAVLGGVATVVAQSTVPAGPNALAFPADYDKGVLYANLDRWDNKQYREFWTSADVIAAAKAGKPIPEGAVITLAAYAAKLDADGKPLLDANGRFIKDKLVAVNPMKKDKAAAAAIPAEIRNGDWIYQTFTPDGKPNDKANLAACYQCHLPFAKEDYLTNLAKLAGTFPSDAKVAATSGPSDVKITNWVFGPGAVKIAAGQAVTWINGDDSPHQITVVGADGKPAQRSDVMLKGQTAKLQFDAAGNIAYFCGLHPSMKGTIEVAAKN
jgi:plastocyanin